MVITYLNMSDHNDIALKLLRVCVKLAPAHLKIVLWVVVSENVSYLDAPGKLKTDGTASLFKHRLLKVLEYERF